MPTRLASTAALLATTALVSACGSTGDSPSGSGASPTSSPAPTVTVTVTTTPTASSTSTSELPRPTATRPGKPNPTIAIPPPAKDPLVIPNDPKAYGQAFVNAWVDRDRAGAARLGSASAVTTAFASTVTSGPVFRSCERAAGSSYCTWVGDEYTMTVRVLNEMAAQGQEHAVTEVQFPH